MVSLQIRKIFNKIFLSWALKRVGQVPSRCDHQSLTESSSSSYRSFRMISVFRKIKHKSKVSHAQNNWHCSWYLPPLQQILRTVDHLLIHCEISWRVWSWWMNIWELQWAAPASLTGVFQSWCPPSSQPFFKKIWWAIFYIIIWSLWKERNQRIFNNTKCSIRLCELILVRLGWWAKGWGESLPYPIEDIIRNPSCLLWCEQHIPKICNQSPNAQWAPLEPGYLKWNVDASFNPLLNRSAIGGVLRNSKGEFLCMFSTPLPPMEINNAEVNAIFRAFQISTASPNRIKMEHIMIESDSLNAVKWCTASEGRPWNLNFHLNFIRNVQLRFPSMAITHHPRSSNHVADALAKQGLHRQSEFLAWI